MTASNAAQLEQDNVFAGQLAVEKMPAHWLMARLGKKVLRPGGIETTEWLIRRGEIGPGDDVVEFAPGLGRTARMILQLGPNTYTGIERDKQAAAFAEAALVSARKLGFSILRGDASEVPLPDAAATVVVGEAMLSMQTLHKKRAIMKEARRVLRPGGRYLIHELAVQPEDIDKTALDVIQQDLSSTIHVGVRIGTVGEWKSWLSDAGFVVQDAVTAPMRLLEPERLIRDEGIAGAARFIFNALRTPGARKRLVSVRRCFRRHRANLCAVAIVAGRLD